MAEPLDGIRVEDPSLRQHQQLGLNRRTASHKLNKMILIALLYETGRCSCLRCGEPLSTDNVSVEHRDDWLDSEDPVDRFFNLENIEFVCKSCNSIHHRSKAEMEDPSLKKAKPEVRDPLPLSIPDRPMPAKGNENEFKSEKTVSGGNSAYPFLCRGNRDYGNVYNQLVRVLYRVTGLIR